MAAIGMLATQNIWAPLDHIGGGDSPDVEWLETLESPTPPPARPPRPLACCQVPEGDSPTNYALGRGVVYPSPEYWDPSPMSVGNYRAVTVALSGRLPFAFGRLVKDAE